MPLTTLGQETRWAYSTPPPSPHGAVVNLEIMKNVNDKVRLCSNNNDSVILCTYTEIQTGTKIAVTSAMKQITSYMRVHNTKTHAEANYKAILLLKSQV